MTYSMTCVNGLYGKIQQFTFFQPAFVNNPLCGAIIFASFFIADYQVGLGCLLGGSIAVLAEMVSKYNTEPHL